MELRPASRSAERRNATPPGRRLRHAICAECLVWRFHHEVYFHRNSVLHGDFDLLAVGTEVRYFEELGDDGPQATTVQGIAKQG